MAMMHDVLRPGKNEGARAELPDRPTLHSPLKACQAGARQRPAEPDLAFVAPGLAGVGEDSRRVTSPTSRSASRSTSSSRNWGVMPLELAGDQHGTVGLSSSVLQGAQSRKPDPTGRKKFGKSPE